MQFKATVILASVRPSAQALKRLKALPGLGLSQYDRKLMKTNSQRHLKLENRVLRRTYENVAGEISDRQWRRIKSALQIRTTCLREITAFKSKVEIYAYLRLNAPKAAIRRADVEQFGRLLDEFPLQAMQGSDLKQTLLLVAERSGKGIAESTIYRWARAIGRLEANRMYERRDVCYMAARLYRHINSTADTHEGLLKVS